MHIKLRLTSFGYNILQTKGTIASFVVVLMTSAATCGCRDNKKQKEVVDAPTALKAHQAFLQKAVKTRETDIKEVVALTKEWFVLSDTLLHHVQPDSIPHRIYGNMTYRSLQDSVANRLEAMVDAEVRSFEDILTVREALYEQQPNDSLFDGADARKFFASLDAAELPKLTKEQAVSSYSTLLKSYLKKGIKSKSDMLRFIRAEDLAFQGFLVHLHELGNVSLKNITSFTEGVCELIFKSACEGQMASDAPIIYMFMRTNRRIIQNAMTCLADIKEGRVTGDDEQAVVYLWMMMKPFFPMDGLTLSLLTDKQKQDLRTLAHELPAVSASLNKGMGWAPLPIEEMPNEIIKEYVSRR